MVAGVYQWANRRNIYFCFTRLPSRVDFHSIQRVSSAQLSVHSAPCSPQRSPHPHLGRIILNTDKSAIGILSSGFPGRWDQTLPTSTYASSLKCWAFLSLAECSSFGNSSARIITVLPQLSDPGKLRTSSTSPYHLRRIRPCLELKTIAGYACPIAQAPRIRRRSEYITERPDTQSLTHKARSGCRALEFALARLRESP